MNYILCLVIDTICSFCYMDYQIDIMPMFYYYFYSFKEQTDSWNFQPGVEFRKLYVLFLAVVPARYPLYYFLKTLRRKEVMT